MGFNYLQTDDRDDYFAQFKSKKTKKKLVSVTLINPKKETLMEQVSTGKVRSYAKQTYLPIGQGGKKIWRKLLESKGYQILNNY